ncbi:MAG TPA: hypothetical protein VJM33_07085 [Microthrixaceae bacterium]|nr:hypothetical protein [Microthrixaceae bacterium]
METTKSVNQIFDESPTTDSTEAFTRLWATMGDITDRVLSRFELQEDPSVADLATFGNPVGPRGSLRAWSGPGVDWMINSWLGDPEAGFTNMHLTVWLGPDTDVPHLGMAWGTLPTLWCFIDLLPRADLFVDLDYVDRYYEPVNDVYMSLKDDPEASPFVSRDTFTRVGVSQSAICVVLPTTDARIAQVGELANLRVGQWLDHLGEATPVPEPRRAALAERDLAMRRNIAERDPANSLAERFYGAELTARLVGSLWGDGRTLPRPGLEGGRT